MDKPATAFFPTTWEEVLADPYLAKLPHKVELNRFGKIELSLHSYLHARLQGEIQRILDRSLTGGSALPECPVQCGRAVRVPDVIWISDARDKLNRGRVACVTPPEICVEVESPCNTPAEMEQKRTEYFAAGASEFWFCSSSGEMEFHSPAGRLEHSRICPEFPGRVEV